MSQIKSFNGKAIYNPKGKAAEYSEWACNFYNGCSNVCEYCYCKKGILAKTMGGNKPTLKKCFKNEEHALKIFEKELHKNVFELRKHGLFFSFSTDPMLKETTNLTSLAVQSASVSKVPVKILTKTTFWVEDVINSWWVKANKNLIAFGFTLTGHDELEPGASTNQERIEAMKRLHDAGFKTFASIEPIIDFDSSMKMILSISDIDNCYCDLLKIGLESNKKYNKESLQLFVNNGIGFTNIRSKIYFKDSLLQQAEINRDDLPKDVCVTRDYNLFQQ